MTDETDLQEDGGYFEPLTPESADSTMLRFFSCEPYNTTWDSRGKMVRVPCDLPSVAGFCSRYDVTPGELAAMVTGRTMELCQVKMEHILTVNGLNRSYDSGLAALIGENKVGWKKAGAPGVTINQVILSEADKRGLERLGIMIAGPEAKVIDATP